MNKIKTIVNAIQCPHCFDVIFSRSQHDFNPCSCRKTAIDGGRDYVRMAYTGVSPKSFELYLIGISDNAVYQDWNKSINKFGRIKRPSKLAPTKYRYTINKNGKFYRYPKKT